VKQPVTVINCIPYRWDLKLFTDQNAFLNARNEIFSDDVWALKDLIYTGGMCSTSREARTIVIGIFEQRACVLAHELLHACLRIFEDIGAPIDPDNSEPFAYLFEHLFDECTAALNTASLKQGRKKRKPARGK
jgi:hypothetical protein